MNTKISQQLRQLPGIDTLLAAALSAAEFAFYPQKILTDALREAVNETRQGIQNRQDIDLTPEAILKRAAVNLNKLAKPNLCRVINAAGVVLHTNLGRAPLSQRAKQAVNDIISNYNTLEYNVADGERGKRIDHVAGMFCRLTGAEDVFVVNNNAAAVFLILSSLAKGREVIVSRGELVEIGGSFRIPDVLKQSGAQLTEIGTTNRTHLADYEKAITENTAAILKVHTSNYRIIGFTASPSVQDLAGLAHKHQLPLIEDLGSGTLIPLPFGDEPTVKERLEKGVDVVAFSGDKLLGSAQAGIILGKKKYIDQLKTHPLARALRIGKLALAALEGTLKDYFFGVPLRDVPALSMLAQSKSELHERARDLASKLLPLEQNGWDFEIIPTESRTGGGAFPEKNFASFAVAATHADRSAAFWETQLRQRKVPIIVRIESNKIIMDVRCLFNSDIEEIVTAFSELEG
jgi:L-seryl-tRNA(Ser) seleniumtransferase